jgi:flagellar assembly factor FliW
MSQDSTVVTEIHLAQGLVGLKELKDFSLVRQPDAAPFLQLLSHGEEQIEFVAIEPGGWVEDYPVEVPDEDAAELELDPAGGDAMLLVLVTVHRRPNSHLTMNLLAPLVINRRTGRGRQVVLQDPKRFSTKHPLGRSDS